MVFESKDGSRYRIFSGGEKVLNAKATSFLYDFAMSGGRLLEKIFSGFFDNRMLEKVSPKTYNTEVVMGDIIVQGNADRATISEIRREQRAALDNMLKEINRLNK